MLLFLRTHKGKILLFLTAMIWGASFVSTRQSLEHVEPFTFNAIRSLIGALSLAICMLFSRWRNRGASEASRQKSGGKLVIGGILCGAALFAASALQQFGLPRTSIGRAGFITSCYIVFVPIMGLFIGRKCPARAWIGVAATAVGLYLLCEMDGLNIGLGDGLMLLCAIMFAVHILVVDRYVHTTDGVALSCIQFLTCGVLSSIATALFEQPSLSEILKAVGPLLYAGLMACGAGHTFQILGQRGTDPTLASVLLSLESVFALLFGWVFYGQGLTLREFFGCALIFGAILWIEIQPRFPGKPGNLRRGRQETERA